MARIGVDLDGVIADFDLAYTTVCNQLFGKPEIGTLPSDWDWTNYGLTPEQHSQAWEEIKKSFCFWMFLKYLPGCKRVRELVSKHDVYFITARVETEGYSAIKQAQNWMLHNFLVTMPMVIVTHDKGPVAKALQLDYFIDDRPKNCIEVKTAVPTCQVYLKTASHNEDWVGFAQESIKRVEDFDSFAKIILEG